MALSGLKDRVVIVTGAASGIGRSTALAFAQAGCKLVAADENAAGLEDLKRELDETDAQAITVVQDASEEADWKKVVEETIAAYGKINFLINNAGRRHFGTIESSTYEEMMDAFKVDSMSVFLGMQNCIPYMKQARAQNEGAAIVNASSFLSLTGVENFIQYITAKAAINAMSKCAAMDLHGTGIRVNALLGGLTKTPLSSQRPPQDLEFQFKQGPSERIGQPEELANACLYLCSDEGAYVNATEFLIDGGFMNARIVKQ